MPGMHGTVAAVTALQKSDLLICLGARFDDRVTGKLRRFAPDAKVIHADIDPAEIGKNRTADVPIVGDCRETHRRPRSSPCRRPTPPARRADLTGWWKQLDGWRETYPLGYDAARPTAPSRRSTSSSGIGEIAGPEAHLRQPASASTRCGPASSSTTRTPTPGSTPAALGTMGYAVPAAMGAKVGRPEATVWAIDGDGCFQMTNQELVTCAIEGIPIKVAVINNGNLGMVRQWQTLFYDGRYSNTNLQSQAHPRLRQARRRDGLRRACAARPRTTSTPRSRRRWRSTTCPSSSTSSSARTRWCGRWCPPARATTRSSPPATRAPSGERTTV